MCMDRKWCSQKIFGAPQIAGLQFVVGRGYAPFLMVIDQEREGHLFWGRVLTYKPKGERCARTPAGGSSKSPLREALLPKDLPWLLTLVI